MKLSLIILSIILVCLTFAWWGYRWGENSRNKEQDKVMVDSLQSWLSKRHNLERMKEREATLYIKEIKKKDSIIAKISKKENAVAVRLENLKPIPHTVTGLETIWKKRYDY